VCWHPRQRLRARRHRAAPGAVSSPTAGPVPSGGWGCLQTAQWLAWASLAVPTGVANICDDAQREEKHVDTIT